MKIRRVVTGHTPQGRSAIASDTELEATRLTHMPGMQLLQIWGADTIPVYPDDGSPMPCQGYFPPAGGFRFGVFVAPPDSSEPINLEAAVAEFQQKFPGMVETFDLTTPGMHTSDTIDLLYIMSGEIFLELDGGVEVHLKAGDTVIESGTRHAWRNRSKQDCHILCAILGAYRKPSASSKPA